MIDWRMTAVAALMAVGIAGCATTETSDSSATSETPGATEQSSTQPAPQAPSDDHPVDLTIDGTQYPVEGEVTCSDHSGGFAISAGAEPNDVFIRLTSGGPRHVGEISFGQGFVGVPLEYRGTQTGSDLLDDGEGYMITGYASEVVDPPSEVTRNFQLSIRCPQG